MNSKLFLDNAKKYIVKALEDKGINEEEKCEILKRLDLHTENTDCNL